MSVRVRAAIGMVMAVMASVMVTATVAVVVPPPAPAVAVNGDEDDGVTMIETFGEHTCGVQDDVLKCWGSASVGRLGIGATTAPGLGWPQTVSSTGGFVNDGSKPIIDLGGHYHTCAVQGAAAGATVGALYCWGNNDRSQVGDGGIATVPAPTRVNTAGSFANVSVSAVDGGGAHNCAVEDGAVFCWGEQNLGRLGNGNTSVGTIRVPTPVATTISVPGFTNTNVTAVSAGFSHTCAIEGGKVFCWGANGTDHNPGVAFVSSLDSASMTASAGGRVGDGSTFDKDRPVTVSASSGFNNTNVTAVSASYEHTCAIENGAVYCWGANSQGQLGNGSTSPSTTPVKVATSASVPGFTNTSVTAISAGDFHTCAVENGNVFCWGQQLFGRLGNGSTGPSAVSTPVTVAAGAVPASATPQITLTGGNAGPHMCMVYSTTVSASSKAYCWGNNRKWATLSNGTTGGFDVLTAAANAVSPELVKWVRPSSATPPAPAGAPRNLTATPARNSMELSWDPPVSSGTYPITNYLVISSPQNRVCITFVSGYNDTSCTIPNLRAGTNYTFTVQALTAAGWGQKSGPSNVAAPYNLRLENYKRTTQVFLRRPIVEVTAVAPGYARGTRVDVWVMAFSGNTPNGSWVEIPRAASVDASGKVTFKRMFPFGQRNKSIALKFESNGEFSNTVVTGPGGRLSLFGTVDLGSRASDRPTTDIEFGIAVGDAAGGDVPVQFHGTNLQPGTAVTATLNPGGRTLFTDTVDETGNAYRTLDVPDDLAAGEYSITFSGTGDDGVAVSETNRFTLDTEGTFTALVDPTPPAAEPAAVGLTAVTPARLADTRGSALVGGDRVLEVQVTGRGGVPAGAAVAALNLTSTQSQGAGFLTVYPCESDRPGTSSLNYVAGRTVANAVTVPLGASGKVCVYSNSLTHVVVDVNGYGSTDVDTAFTPIEPTRALDTRDGNARLANGGYVEVTMPDTVPDSATAVALNVTAVNPSAPGFFTVYPCGTTPPLASNLNYGTAENVAGSVVADLGADGKVCVFTNAAADVVVDVNGWYGADGDLELQTMPAMRMIDTRLSLPDVVETDPVARDTELAFGGAPAAATSVTAVSVDAGLRSRAEAVVANLTVVNPTQAGYLTAYDCGSGRPLASNINYGPGEVRANQIIVPSSTESICVYSMSQTHIVVDLVGRYVAR